MINYEKAAAEAINRVKQDLATKEIEHRSQHEKEKQNMNEALLTTRPETSIQGKKKRVIFFALKLTGCFALQRDETRVVLPLTESRLLGTHENKCKDRGSETRGPLVINYEKAAAEAINRVKQDLATKEIEHRLQHEKEKQNMNEALLTTGPETEAGGNLINMSNCNTLKMMTGKPFGITKIIGARIMSIITVGGHEVTRNMSEPSDQTLMHIEVYADYLRTITPQTPSTALRALLRRSGESIRIDNRYTEAYGLHEVMLNRDGINIYTKTIITSDEDLAGLIYVGREELKVRSIGHCAMTEEDAMHL